MEEIDIIKKLSIKYKLDTRIVKYITNHPFDFLRSVIENDYDEINVQFKYLGKFKLKSKYKGMKYLSNDEFIQKREELKVKKNDIRTT